MWTLLMIALTAQSGGVQAQRPESAQGPPTWIAFSAELKISHPTRPLAFGRHLQDEHGCMRRETVHPDGSLIVNINNYEAAKSYSLLRGNWTSHEIRLIPGLPRRPITRRVTKKLSPIDGYETYLSVTPVKSPRGDYTMEYTVIPALNFFIAGETRPNGDTIIAQNIRLGSPDHAEFLPPPGATIADRPGVRSGQFSAVVVSAAFAGRAPVELTTTEERPVDLKTPIDETIQLVTTVVDESKNVVRVRIMKNAVQAGVGNVTGDLLDEVLVTLGGTVQTTKLPENFSLTVTRIRDRRVRE